MGILQIKYQWSLSDNPKISCVLTQHNPTHISRGTVQVCMLGKPQNLTKQVIRVLGTWSRRKERWAREGGSGEEGRRGGSGFYLHLTPGLQVCKLGCRILGKPRTLTKQGIQAQGLVVILVIRIPCCEVTGHDAGLVHYHPLLEIESYLVRNHPCINLSWRESWEEMSEELSELFG